VLRQFGSRIGVTRPVASSSGALAVGMLPLFLFGALSPSIGDDLGFGPAATGAAVAVFFVSGGLSAVPVGWLTEHLGAPRAIRLGVSISAGSGIAIGALAESWWHLALALAVAGVAIAFVDTASSAWFAASVPDSRQGAAFGIKEASVPAASLLAGVSIPLLAADLGWRTVFVLGTALVPVVWSVVPAEPRHVTRDHREPLAEPRWGPLALFAGGVALGTGAATAAATFLVPGLEDRGWTADAAGTLLAVASSSSIAIRLTLGWLSDRHPQGLWRVVGSAMAVGAAGPALLATGGGDPVMIAGALLALGAGWGWTGVAFHAVLVATRQAPALGAGLVLGGLSIGGAAGPALFGSISARASYSWSWALAAMALAAGAALTRLARSLQDRTPGSAVVRSGWGRWG
jgi:MFS family permease